MSDLHWNIAVDALSKCVGYDYTMPQSDAVIAAYAEALERGRVDNVEDVLEAVARMYFELGEPGWRPTPKVLVRYSQQVWRERMFNEREARAIEGPEKITFAEYCARHPEITFPKVGKDIPSA